VSDRARYGWLKLLTILGPTIFVSVGEYVRQVYLRHYFSAPVVSAIVIGTTVVGAVWFSWFVFRAVERIERERRTYKEALLALTERERIAREMHDGVAQNLAVLKLETYRLKSLAAGDGSSLQDELETIDKLINQTYLEVRQTLYDLRASQRLDEGFWPTIQRQLQEFERQTGIMALLDPPNPLEEPWDALASMQILRIVQEALANVRKHAQASTVKVCYVRQGDRIRLAVADDGRGFLVSASGSPANHYGLQVMQERAEAIGATIAIESWPGQGTTITLTVPLQRRGMSDGKGAAHVGG
jgi:signal transduction histidine kinase